MLDRQTNRQTDKQMNGEVDVHEDSTTHEGLEKLVGGNWNQSKFEKRQRIEFKKLELDDRRDREKDRARGRGRYR